MLLSCGPVHFTLTVFNVVLIYLMIRYLGMYLRYIINTYIKAWLFPSTIEDNDPDTVAAMITSSLTPPPSPTSSRGTTASPQIECSVASDVVFVLDASSSEGRDNFMKQVHFVGNVTKSLPIGPDSVQV